MPKILAGYGARSLSFRLKKKTRATKTPTHISIYSCMGSIQKTPHYLYFDSLSLLSNVHRQDIIILKNEKKRK